MRLLQSIAKDKCGNGRTAMQLPHSLDTNMAGLRCTYLKISQIHVQTAGQKLPDYDAPTSKCDENTSRKACGQCAREDTNTNQKEVKLHTKKVRLPRSGGAVGVGLSPSLKRDPWTGGTK